MNVDEQLKIHVERAVRPVLGRNATKLKMREELYAHLQGIFSEEQARHDTEDAALETARRRFGDPRAMTRELQATVDWPEKCSSWFEMRTKRMPGESEFRHAVRNAGIQLGYGAAGMLLTVFVLTPLVSYALVSMGLERRNMHSTHMDGYVIGGIVVLFGWFGALFPPIFRRLIRQLKPASLWSVSISRFIGLLFITMLTVLFGGWLLAMMATREFDESLKLLFPVWMVLALFVTAILVVIARVSAIEQSRVASWLELPIIEGPHRVTD